jgi:hypothetical protein
LDRVGDKAVAGNTGHSSWRYWIALSCQVLTQQRDQGISSAKNLHPPFMRKDREIEKDMSLKVKKKIRKLMVNVPMKHHGTLILTS